MPPEDPRPWWKGPKRRPELEPEEVWKGNTATAKDKAGTVVTIAIFGTGLLAKNLRQLVEGADVFVGRYLLLSTVAYVGVKFVHFKLWDPIPF